MERIVPWSVVVLLLTGACFWKPRPMRAFMGGFFALMGLGVHGAFLLTNPGAYVDFAQGALLPLYRDLAVAVVQLQPTGFGIAMLLFEVTLAALMLSRGRYVRIGMLAGSAFLIAIAPLGLEVLPNMVLAIGLFWLARQEYPITPWAEFTQWRRARRSPSAG